MNDATRDNKYQYNGKEWNDDFGLNWYDYGARFYDPAIGRFTTIDRFAEKYYSFAPYQYGANNPILYIDVNGDSILIRHKGEVIRYDNGKLSWAKSGKQYDGKALNKNGNLKGFVKQVVNALDDIRSGGSNGNDLVTRLENDPNRIIIQKAKGDNTTLGLVVRWNPSVTDGGLDVNGGTSRPAFIGLAHELAHAYDAADDGQVTPGTWFTSPIDNKPANNAEKYASHWENRIRAENNLSLREYYSTTAYPQARLVQGNKDVHGIQISRTVQSITGISPKVIKP